MDMGNPENGVVPTSARGLRVLLVDHDTTSLMYIASVLEEQSYKELGYARAVYELGYVRADVTTTELASVALCMIREREGQYDLVLADINMPEMDGFMFLEQILLQTDVPIILMSPRPNKDMARKALEEGACFFLRKPARARDIINIWQHVFKKKRRLRMEIEMTDNEKNAIPQENSRGSAGNDLCGTKIEHLSTDLKGKSKLIENEVVIIEEDHVREPQRVSSERLVISENGNHGELKRKREKNMSDLNMNHSSKEMKDKKNMIFEKKSSRMSWTPDLHDKFMEAIRTLGEKRTHPKALLRLMNVPNLTHRHVASHLQKYRDRIKRISDNCATNPPMLTKPRFNFYGGHGSAQPMNLQGPNRMTRPWLNLGSSVHYNLETLKRQLQASNFSSNKIKNVGKAADSGKGKQSLGFEGCSEDFRNVHQHLNLTRDVDANPNQFPMTFTGINEGTSDFAVGQIGCSSSGNPKNLLEGFHGGDQGLNAVSGVDIPLGSMADYSDDLMKLHQWDEFEEFINSHLMAEDNDRFSELLG